MYPPDLTYTMYAFKHVQCTVYMYMYMYIHCTHSVNLKTDCTRPTPHRDRCILNQNKVLMTMTTATAAAAVVADAAGWPTPQLAI